VTPEQQEYFEELQFMFASKGWKHFVGDFADFHKALKDSALDLSNAESFWRAKGRNDAFNQVLSYEQLIRDGYKAIQENETDV
jgi:hypothetical protein